MAVDADGTQVYVAVFESGNQTTILGGGIDGLGNDAFPPNVVNEAVGPYGGTNPPPNDGSGFTPVQNPSNPAPPAVGLIVKNVDGVWLDDNGGDWTALVSGSSARLSGRRPGWRLVDRDMAIIDASNLSVSYATGLMNVCMSLAVNPGTGHVTVVGTDATNEVRYEPNLSGRFVRVNMATVNPSSPDDSPVVDLNPHLDYTVSTVPQDKRDESVGDPRAVVWNSDGTRGYISGMGSNNLIVIDPSGQRIGKESTVEVGESPTGLALDEGRNRLCVINKFDASISVVDIELEAEIERVSFFDPSPRAIKVGRKHLYDTHKNSARTPAWGTSPVPRVTSIHGWTGSPGTSGIQRD